MPDNGAVTATVTKTATLDERWAVFHRWGPYALLLAGTLVSWSAADATGMTAGERWTSGALVAGAAALHLWWNRAARTRPGPCAASVWYYAVRWAIGFALTWTNPLFAFYAAIGYFGVDRLLPRRARTAGLFATAVTVAGSQSGGLPPSGATGWALFGAVLAVNVLLVALFRHFGALEEARTRAQAAAIAELERTNAALQQALDENAALHAQLLVQAREAGIADERRRLAAEIHDTLAQGLTGIIAQLQAVASAPDTATAREHVDRALDLARHSLGEARRSVHNLAPVALADGGLPQALEKTVTEWGERTGIQARFTTTGTVEPLHDEVAATLLRIAQEALSNTARHARATRVGVTLSYIGDEVTLDIRDDGCGFDPLALPARSRTGGFGLDGMRARAERIAGFLDVESEPGHGTAVSARVPLVRHD
ncbi:histidine kinase [Streptomyces sp. F-3]|uniref:sensor histidine kinase n=1 Tax=Streptomyces TaxID=1883 RepID=UPI0007C29C9B|nr:MULTISPECIES: sensor histidine kinase [Streptomyces]MDN5382881.1 sensor histidine kinase [Streptomyces sp. LB8]GAT83645.1 histidine kinase [Streptomyces sp. F-3]